MHNYQKNTRLFENVQNVYSPQTDGMIRSSFNIGCHESKVIFKWRKNNNKKKNRPLQGANVRTSCISQTNTVDTASHTE